MLTPLPYCGSPPSPGELLTRFNWDPRLMMVLAALLIWQLAWLRRQTCAAGPRRLVLVGWAVASAALISPLCALSVALFSARVGQHMLLILIAAPLIAAGLPPAPRAERLSSLWLCTAVFFLALWIWHMPVPYDATFSSTRLYWLMHVTLFGSSIFLWRELIHHAPASTGQVLAAGAITFVQMGLLGAVLTFSVRPMFAMHLLTTQAWGLTALQDQQLGGALMWVPGIALFLWSALRSFSHLWDSAERARPA